LKLFFAEGNSIQIEYPLSGKAIRWIPYPGLMVTIPPGSVTGFGNA